MIKIIDYACNTKSELNTMERRYIDVYKSTLNCNIPTRTNKEYYDENRDKIAENRKKYYNDNRDKIAEYCKEYHNENREKISQHMKQYYIDNKEKITATRQQKVKCDKCGCEVRRDCLNRHKKSLNCINFVTK